MERVILGLERKITYTFNYRLLKAYWDDKMQVFRALKFDLNDSQHCDIRNHFGKGVTKLQLQALRSCYGINQTRIPIQSIWKLILEEFLSIFNMFQVFAIIVWYLDKYISYANVIGLMSIGSIIISVYETRTIESDLNKMSLYSCPVTVHRAIEDFSEIDGTKMIQSTEGDYLDSYQEMPKLRKIDIDSEELVAGDLVEIPVRCKMPCDIILLSGSCIMDESMLTGESIPVIKSSLTHTKTKFSEEDRNTILFSGTECLQKKGYGNQSVIGIVLSPGFYTSKGQLVRSIMFPKLMKFKFDEDAKKFVGIMFLMAATMFMVFFIWVETGGDEWSTFDIVIRALEIFTTAVPPA